MKKDALYVNLKSEKETEKKELEACINTMESQIAKLQIEYTSLHSECVKKDTLNESLRSENYNEKERLNAQIEKMTIRISQLQKNFTKMRCKAYYLATTKIKLHQTIQDLKKQNMINSELQNLLEVCMHSYLQIPIPVMVIILLK